MLLSIIAAAFFLFIVSLLAYWTKRVSSLNPLACIVFVIGAMGSVLPTAVVFVGFLAHQLPKPNKPKSKRAHYAHIAGTSTEQIVATFLAGD